MLRIAFILHLQIQKRFRAQYAVSEVLFICYTIFLPSTLFLAFLYLYLKTYSLDYVFEKELLNQNVVAMLSSLFIRGLWLSRNT